MDYIQYSEKVKTLQLYQPFFTVLISGLCPVLLSLTIFINHVSSYLRLLSLSLSVH